MSLSSVHVIAYAKRTNQREQLVIVSEMWIDAKFNACLPLCTPTFLHYIHGMHTTAEFSWMLVGCCQNIHNNNNNSTDTHTEGKIKTIL